MVTFPRLEQLLPLGLLVLLPWFHPALGQIPTFSGNVPDVIPNVYGSPPDPVPTAPAAGPAASSTPMAHTGTYLGSGTLQYDPALDNRLKSPTKQEGLFGMKIVEVERRLRQYGARPYSYAFGKYSRMTFSVYVLTLMFDRERKLGGVVVSPKPPFSQVESQARSFFLKLFLQNADMQKFKTVIDKRRLEIWFEDNKKFAKSILESLERKENFLR